MSKIEMFLKNVMPEPNTGCWLWYKACDNDGYGISWIADANPKQQRAHRYSYQIFKGEFDKKLFVLHHCDNPTCVNPDHLFLGTVQDNSNDMKNKKRQANGQRQWKAKLNEDDVIKIRQLHDEGLGYRPIAKMFNVSHNNIARVVKKLNWTHV